MQSSQFPSKINSLTENKTGVSPFSPLYQKFASLQIDEDLNDISFDNEDEEYVNEITLKSSLKDGSNTYIKRPNNEQEEYIIKQTSIDKQFQNCESKDDIRNSTQKVQTSQKQSFSLRNLNPSMQVMNLKTKYDSNKDVLKSKNKNYNIREAIQKNDLVRIRNGSPGSRNQVQGHAPKTTQIQQDAQKDKQHKCFENDMEKNGITDDLQEINRFNYVLLSRSVEFDQYDETQLSSMCNQGSFFNKSPYASPKQTNMQQAQDTQNKQYMLPFQRRLKSISPPRLQICNENYIVYS